MRNSKQRNLRGEDKDVRGSFGPIEKESGETAAQMKQDIVKTLNGINGNMKEFCEGLEERFEKMIGSTQKKIGKASGQLTLYSGKRRSQRGSLAGGRNVLERIENQAKMFLTDYEAAEGQAKPRALPYKKNFHL